MAITIGSIVFLFAATWTWFDRRAGRAAIIVFALAAVAVAGCLAIADDFSAGVVLGGTALAFATIGYLGARLLKRGLEGGAQRLRNDADRPTAVDADRSRERGQAKKLKGAEIRVAVKRQRDQAERLVAGNVQLLDLSSLFGEGEASLAMSRAEALQIAEAVAQKVLNSADVMVRAEAEGLIFLFDGLDRDAAEQKSQQIADAISDALAGSVKPSPFVAKGFAHELDDFMDGAIIDTVDDLIRIVQLAHTAYVQRERSLAKQLDRSIRIEATPLIEPESLACLGYEAQVIRIHSDGAQSRCEHLTFAQLDAAFGAEVDCTAILKLPGALRSVRLEADQIVVLAIRFETVTHPLYLDNLVHALRQLPKGQRDRLACNLIIERTEVSTLFEKAVLGIAARFAQVLVHPCHPFTDYARLPELGIKGVTVSMDRLGAEAAEATLAAAARTAHAAKLPLAVLGVPPGGEIAHELKLPYTLLA